ncbi:alpha 1,2-mannosyltransferase 2.4.1 [Savitreella phatthalungensis]
MVRASLAKLIATAAAFAVLLYVFFGTASRPVSYDDIHRSEGRGSGGDRKSSGDGTVDGSNPSLLYQAGEGKPVVDLSRGVQAWHKDRFIDVVTPQPPKRELEKATLVMLVRNSELHAARFAIRGIEDRFNRRFGYDWVFFNDEPFTEEFVKYVSGLTSGQAHFAVIPTEHWSIPDHVDKAKAQAGMDAMKKEGVIYGESLSYRHMCRFNSGFFYEHELMKKYDYYFRIEPFVEFYCDFYDDPFKLMREQGKKYGWVMAMYEYERTIPTLWDESKRFFLKNPQYVSKRNSLHFMIDDPEEPYSEAGYNLCHFWSNFEIGDLNWLRSDGYRAYFKHLDEQGGFFYERWGDAPVHSIAASVMLDMSEIHHFGDVGYRHNPYTRCPPEERFHTSGQCSCNPKDNFDSDGYSCWNQWQRAAKQGALGKYQAITAT